MRLPKTVSAFAFPDLVDGRAYIRARHAEVVSRTSVRFRPAAFPTTTCGAARSDYLYTFASGNGYAATALQPAAFDQPYGLYSTPNALTSLHLRYLNGIGPALGLEQNVIDNNDGFLAGAVDMPVHSAIDEGLNGYRRLGDAGTVSLGAVTDEGYHEAAIGFTQAIGTLVSRLNYGISNTGASSAILSLRTRDRELFDGITWHTSVNYGFIAQDGGVYTLAPRPLASADRLADGPRRVPRFAADSRTAAHDALGHRRRPAHRLLVSAPTPTRSKRTLRARAD